MGKHRKSTVSRLDFSFSRRTDHRSNDFGSWRSSKKVQGMIGTTAALLGWARWAATWAPSSYSCARMCRTRTWHGGMLWQGCPGEFRNVELAGVSQWMNQESSQPQEVLQVPELMKLLRAKFGKSSRLLLILELLSCSWQLEGPWSHSGVTQLRAQEPTEVCGPSLSGWGWPRDAALPEHGCAQKESSRQRNALCSKLGRFQSCLVISIHKYHKSPCMPLSSDVCMQINGPQGLNNWKLWCSWKDALWNLEGLFCYASTRPNPMPNPMPRTGGVCPGVVRWKGHLPTFLNFRRSLSASWSIPRCNTAAWNEQIDGW